MGTLPVRPQTIQIINQALWGVVNEKGGTGGALRRPEADVAGKTGTAQVIGLPQDEKARKAKRVSANFRDHALFACFAPYGKSGNRGGGHPGKRRSWRVRRRAGGQEVHRCLLRQEKSAATPGRKSARPTAGERVSHAQTGSPSHPQFRLDPVHPGPAAQRHRPAQHLQRRVQPHRSQSDAVLRQAVPVDSHRHRRNVRSPSFSITVSSPATPTSSTAFPSSCC